MGVNSREQLAAAEAVFQRRARLARHGGGRHADRAGDGLVQLRHGDRPRRDHRAQRVLRPRRGGRGRRRHPGQLPHGRRRASARARASGRSRASVRAPTSAPARTSATSSRSRTPRWKRAPRPITSPTSATARVGEGANIGAGTIFCNYDGFNKHFTDVGKGVFVGSNASLVAPVKIGDGAYIGSGSVISKNVDADALALERAEQEQRPGWAAKFRAMMGRRKKQPLTIGKTKQQRLN